MSDVIEIENLPELTSPTGEDGVVINDDSQPEGSSLKTAITKIKNMFVNGLYLTSERKFAEEKRTDLSSSTTGWVTIAETAYDVIVQACSGRCSIMTGNGYGLTVEYCLRPYSSGMTHQNNTLKIIGMCDTVAGFGTNIGGVRIAYAASDSAGIKLQVYIITEQILYTQISDNLSRIDTETGLKLITATTTDIDKTPDGSTASYLEAGAELQAVGGLDYLDQRISCVAVSTTVLRVTIVSPEILKQNGDTITFPTGFDFVQSDGTVIATIPAGATVAIDTAQTKAHTIVGFLTSSGLTVGENGFAFGGSITAEIS